MQLLAVSAVSLAFLHALAPDHWLPFVALARGSRWPMRRLAGVATLAGVGHVVSSLLLGGLGLAAGWAVHRLHGVEAFRGSVVAWLLIGFGVAYGVWGLKHAQHPHPHVSLPEAVKAYATRRVWMLIAILVFGPCEPLIPLMFLAYKEGLAAVLAISALFSVVTVAMVAGQSCLTYAGLRRISAPWMERYAHALSGLVIVLTAIGVMLLGV
jgi:hypothetical protein